jgi:hypothetical protein
MDTAVSLVRIFGVFSIPRGTTTPDLEKEIDEGNRNKNTDDHSAAYSASHIPEVIPRNLIHALLLKQNY